MLEVLFYFLYCLSMGKVQKLLAFFTVCLLVLPNTSAVAQTSKNLCGKNTRAIQCQGGKGGTGNGFYDPRMNPKYNPNVNPKYNPMADPKYNPMADPRYNPMANPKYNPGAKPCDLGIAEPGKTCPKR